MKILFFLIFFSIYFVLISCSVKTALIEDTQKNLQINKNKSLDYKHLKEGFISNNKYLIVIVDPIGLNSLDSSEIKRLAKRRTLLSLKRYLLNKNGVFNRNVNAYLLNLIEQHGTLKINVIKDETRNVHLFEINKTDLRQSLDNIASKR